MSSKQITEMIGATIVSMVDGNVGDDHMIFVSDTGRRFTFWYEPDCCASCNIEDICGDMADLIGSPVTLAEECSSECADTPPPGTYEPESYTWTFYRFGTAKGIVTVRWYGTSNGYYSESVSFCASGSEDHDRGWHTHQ